MSMDNWSFQREEAVYELLPEGNYRVRVKEAEKAVSKNGNDMLILKFEVSGSTSTLYHYIVFMPDRPEITNRNLTQFYDSFKDIALGDTNFANWIGKVGAVAVKHDLYNGEKRAKIASFIRADKQSSLPPWREPNSDGGAVPQVDTSEIPDMQLPF